MHNDRARDRLHGVQDSLKKVGIHLDQSRILRSTYDLGEAKKVSHELLNRNRPSAIICGNDIIAQGVMLAAQRLDIRIPDQLSVVGIGGFGGCNNFGGKYELNGERLIVGPLAMTRKACMNGMDDEQAFVGALQNAFERQPKRGSARQ